MSDHSTLGEDKGSEDPACLYLVPEWNYKKAGETKGLSDIRIQQE